MIYSIKSTQPSSICQLLGYPPPPSQCGCPLCMLSNASLSLPPAVHALYHLYLAFLNPWRAGGCLVSNTFLDHSAGGDFNEHPSWVGRGDLQGRQSLPSALLWLVGWLVGFAAPLRDGGETRNRRGAVDLLSAFSGRCLRPRRERRRGNELFRGLYLPKKIENSFRFISACLLTRC